MSNPTHKPNRVKVQIVAAATAALALPLVAALSLTGGTVAALQDTITARASVGVEGVTYGIARGVSHAVNAQRVEGGSATGSYEENITADSRSGGAYQRTNPAGGKVIIPNVLDTRDTQGVRSCASSNRNGNTQHCPGPSTTSSSPLVTASSGNSGSNAGWVEKYQIGMREHINGSSPSIQIHDVYTRVECRADGTVEATKPSASWEFGGNVWFGQGRAGYFETRTTGQTSRDLTGPNQRNRHYLGMRSNGSFWDTAMTVEVQTINQTFSNPPRAVSAVVVYLTTADHSPARRYTDIAFVSKSECAVSVKGQHELSFATTFPSVIPAISPQPLFPVSGGHRYIFQNQPLTDFSHVATTAGPTGRATRMQADPDVAGEPTPPTTSASTRPAEETAATSQAPPSTPDTTSTTPSPAVTRESEPVTASEPLDPAAYRRADGSPLSETDRALVDEAIEAAQVADEGPLSRGEYQIVSDQLDDTTLIIIRPDGSTLRLIWTQ